MKRVILRLTKYLAILALAVFSIVFIWANWTPLSPGEKQDPVNFVVYNVSNISNDDLGPKIKSAILKMEGVGGSNYIPVMKTIIVNFKPLEITEAEIISTIKKKYNYRLTRMKVNKNVKQCPMASTLSTSTKIRRALNIRG